MICHGNSIQIVTMNGVLRQSKKMVAQLHFEFPIESIGTFGWICWDDDNNCLDFSRIIQQYFNYFSSLL